MKAESSVLLIKDPHGNVRWCFTRQYNQKNIFNSLFLHWILSKFCNVAISENSEKNLLTSTKKKIHQSIVFHPVTSLFSMEVLRWLIQSRDITQRFTIHQPGIEKMDGRFFLKTC